MPAIALFRVLAHNPRILSRFRAGRLLDDGVLAARDRELLILRTCFVCRCEYEWGVHAAAFAPKVGLTEADVLATCASPATWASLPTREALLLRVADALVADRRLDPALQEHSANCLTQAELVEVLAIVARYVWVSMVANVAQLAAEPGARRFPQAS
jgi:alkylhydroperoxidase family enzyme